jgi:hypothetical protein
MTALASDIIASVRGTLLDASGATWSDTELLRYADEAIKATCLVKPDAYTVQAALALAAGTEQSLPADSTGLVDIIRNSASRSAVTLVDKELLVESNRFFPAATGSVDIEHFTADPRNPRRFLVSPPAANTSSVVAVYGITPASMASTAAAFPLPDAYVPCTIDYVLSRAYGKNSRRQDLAKEDYHKRQWAGALGLKSQSQALLTPHVAQTPGQ